MKGTSVIGKHGPCKYLELSRGFGQGPCLLPRIALRVPCGLSQRVKRRRGCLPQTPHLPNSSKRTSLHIVKVLDATKLQKKRVMQWQLLCIFYHKKGRGGCILHCPETLFQGPAFCTLLEQDSQKALGILVLVTASLYSFNSYFFVFVEHTLQVAWGIH